MTAYVINTNFRRNNYVVPSYHTKLVNGHSSKVIEKAIQYLFINSKWPRLHGGLHRGQPDWRLAMGPQGHSHPQSSSSHSDGRVHG